MEVSVYFFLHVVITVSIEIPHAIVSLACISSNGASAVDEIKMLLTLMLLLSAWLSFKDTCSFAVIF